MSILSQKRGADIVLQDSCRTKSPKKYADLDAIGAKDPIHVLCTSNINDFAGLERDLKLLDGYGMMMAKYEAIYPPHTIGRGNAFDVVLLFYQPAYTYIHSKVVNAMLTGGSFWARHRKDLAGPDHACNVTVNIVKTIATITAQSLVRTDLEKSDAALREKCAVAIEMTACNY